MPSHLIKCRPCIFTVYSLIEWSLIVHCIALRSGNRIWEWAPSRTDTMNGIFLICPFFGLRHREHHLQEIYMSRIRWTFHPTCGKPTFHPSSSVFRSESIPTIRSQNQFHATSISMFHSWKNQVIHSYGKQKLGTNEEPKNIWPLAVLCLSKTWISWHKGSGVSLLLDHGVSM